MITVKKASPKDLIWAGSVQWESGHGAPTYAYVFGLDEIVVDTALQHIQEAVTQKEFHENYDAWVPWLGQSKKTSQEEVFEGINESIKIRGPSRHQLDEMWLEGAHMPEVLKHIETEPLVIDLPTLAFDDLSPYCQNPGALKPFVIGGNTDLEPDYNTANTKGVLVKQRHNKQAMMEGEPVEAKLDTMHSVATEAYEKVDEVKATLGLSEDDADVVGLNEVQLRIGEVMEILNTWEE